MVADPKATEDMKRLIAAMNSGISFEEPEPEPETINENSSYLPPDVEAMKSILTAFHSAQDPKTTLNERVAVDRELREALVTETTAKGTRIGSWEIVINENYKGLKSYDVTNIHSGEAIASELTIYDAALKIARCLNEGGTINSREIRDILNTEADYEKYRRDAAIFKKRMTECRNDGRVSKAMIMEDRYSDALSKAKIARIKLISK